MILYFLGFRQESYSGAVLSEVHYSKGYVYPAASANIYSEIHKLEGPAHYEAVANVRRDKSIPFKSQSSWGLNKWDI
jgi:hypothetical protein